MLQIYARVEGRESGDSADVVNSGSTLVYVRPGVNFTITEKMRGYLFAQVPVHQRVNGLQFEPRYTVTLGVYYAM